MTTQKFSLKIILLFLTCQIPLNCLSQSVDNGIKFESGLTWDQVKNKAKKENKYIFIDCFATWCGPCKMMDQEVYPRKKAGDFFNANFINIKVQMDKTPKDADIIKAWYKDAEVMKHDYKIGAYPTFLFFSPDGHIVHKLVGSQSDAGKFIAAAGDALDPQKQYYTLIGDIKSHKNDSVFLYHALQAAVKTGDNDDIISIEGDYFDSLKYPFAKENLEELSKFTGASGHRIFDFFVASAPRIDLLMGDSLYTENLLSYSIYSMEVAPLFKNGQSVIDWQKVSRHINAKYPTLKKTLVDMIQKGFRMQISEEVVRSIDAKVLLRPSDFEKLSQKLQLKVKYPGFEWILQLKEASYYANKQLWNEMDKTVHTLLLRYGNEIDAEDLNDITWDLVFTHSDNPNITQEALKCMQRSIDKNAYGVTQNNLDTYANLLYKSGQSAEAIFWENKALSMARQNKEEGDEKVFKATLSKMQQGVKTWTENSYDPKVN